MVTEKVVGGPMEPKYLHVIMMIFGCSQALSPWFWVVYYYNNKAYKDPFMQTALGLAPFVIFGWMLYIFYRVSVFF